MYGSIEGCVYIFCGTGDRTYVEMTSYVTVSAGDRKVGSVTVITENHVTCSVCDLRTRVCSYIIQ